FQVIYNIFDQSPEARLFPACLKRQVAVIARVPFDEGSLTGKITPDTRFDPGDFRAFYFQGDRKRQVFERVEKLQADLGESARNLPEIALRFCLHHPAVNTVIPGMRKPGHVEANCAVSDGASLSAEQLAILKRHAWDKDFYQALCADSSVSQLFAGRLY